MIGWLVHVKMTASTVHGLKQLTKDVCTYHVIFHPYYMGKMLSMEWSEFIRGHACAKKGHG